MPILGGLPPRNPGFVGREDLLSRLRGCLAAGPMVLLPGEGHELGGTGRTQLATEYVYRYAETYDLVWWIPSDLPIKTPTTNSNRKFHINIIYIYIYIYLFLLHFLSHIIGVSVYFDLFQST